MNYIGAIVKLLETPKLKFINFDTLVIEIRVQLYQARKIGIVRLVLWENLARQVINFYKINDYMLIEGYISFQDNIISIRNKKSLKKIIITALKVHPLLLNNN